MKLVTPKVGAKHELLLNKPAIGIFKKEYLLDDLSSADLSHLKCFSIYMYRGHIFSCVRPFYE
jgi:hypothetical protein